MTPPEEGWSLDDDPWAGMLDEHGDLMEIEPAAAVAAEAVASGAENVRLAYLPPEFWGARELFKKVWSAAKAEGTAPDAVLGAVLARASAMVSHRMSFYSSKPGTLNLFVNVVAPSGIGKTEAMRTASRLILPPTYLTEPDGSIDYEKFREAGLGSGEGVAEAYMGMIEKDTGEFYTSGKNKGDPKTKTVRAQVRNNAFLFLDEGEALTKMLERRGNTVGTVIRTAWTGGTLGQANAQELTTRTIPDGSYALGILIGYQPHTAQKMLEDSGGGTPQRFLWLSALDPEMADRPGEPPEPFRLPLCDGHGREERGIIRFPAELAQLLWDQIKAKNRSEIIVDELDSHEPLMRCKLAALLCLLDGRRHVDPDDWRLAGTIWNVSCAVRDRLVEFGRQRLAAQTEAEREKHISLAEASEVARIEVSERVVGYARRIATEVHGSFDPLPRSEMRRAIKSSLRKSWDAGLAYAVARQWVKLESDGAKLGVGDSVPT